MLEQIQYVSDIYLYDLKMQPATLNLAKTQSVSGSKTRLSMSSMCPGTSILLTLWKCMMEHICSDSGTLSCPASMIFSTTQFLLFITHPSALLIQLLPLPLMSAPWKIHWAISLISYLPPSFLASRISLTCAVLVGTSFIALTVLFPRIYSEWSSFCVTSLVFLGI